MVFMRFGAYNVLLIGPSFIFAAWRVQPRNYLLFACHFTNATAQSINDARFVKYWHMGGREEKLGLSSSTKEGEVTKAIKAAHEKSSNGT